VFHFEQALGHLSSALGELQMWQARAPGDTRFDTQMSERVERCRATIEAAFDELGEVYATVLPPV
jgi:hypothetical protein